MKDGELIKAGWKQIPIGSDKKLAWAHPDFIGIYRIREAFNKLKQQSSNKSEQLEKAKGSSEEAL